MKRTTMKNAPVLPKISGDNIADETPQQPQFTAPAAPVLGDLSRRLQSMKGNSITLPVCGRDVDFTLETVASGMVEKATMVWAGNERDQSLLTQVALNDLIPSFMSSGQQNPAFGRKVSGIIEIADGSRRRKTAIITQKEYRVLVGNLDDQQMMWLSQIGNDYRPTSAYERGKRYNRRLENEFEGNLSRLAESENVDRKIITRCMKTASLPREIISLFSHPGELSARAGEGLSKQYNENKEVMLSLAQSLYERKLDGEIFGSDEIIQLLNNSEIRTRKPLTKEHVFSKGAVAKYNGDKVLIKLDKSKLPDGLVSKIEDLIKKHTSKDSSISFKVNSQLEEIEKVVKAMKVAADIAKVEISEKALKGNIRVAMNILNGEGTEQEKQKRLVEHIRSEFS